jgi:hypothetical protein
VTRGLHWKSDAPNGVEIVCKARSHENRAVIIRRFAPLEDGDWQELEVYRVRVPHPVRTPMAGQAGRQRFRLECDLCGQTVVQREETLFPRLDQLRGMLPENGWLAVSLAAL